MSEAYHIRMRKRAHSMIVRRGFTGVLRRAAGERGCFLLEDAYNPNAPRGGSAQKLPRFFLVSALGENNVALDPAPDNHEDVLILTDPQEDSGEVELIITQPPGRLSPGGIVIYYELACERP